MTNEEQTSIKLGREVIRIISDVVRASQNEHGYARREMTYPGGNFIMFIVKDKLVADLMEGLVATHLSVLDVKPPSEELK